MNIVRTFRKHRRTVAVTSAAVLALSLAACGGGESGSGGGSEDKAKAAGIDLVKSGQLTICTHLPYKPFQYKDGTDVVGFDVDLLKLLSDDLGLKVDVVNIEWAQVTSGAAFQAKKCDIGMGAMTITPERQAALSITDPYMDATQVLMAKKDSGIKGLADLKGKKIGAQADTTGKKYADDNAAANGYTVIPFNDLALQVNNVKSGRVDAGINDNGVLYDFVKDNPEMAVVAEFDTGEQYGFAALKDGSGPKIVAKFNELLTKAKSDGKYNEIYKTWFGVEPKK
ncbi:transporter substrate-binding domain-containing protein [Kribbella sandramycini]|uniref:Polar amino acid transport system substrate-binding protein n=1 Tax=Kribbella sandramycini TaxID=60450 RepID=A0A7Y4L5E8_9ACTN|nr:transporter substrate-binding domain-containing protein [Kribbella sandramycini]MBB6571075.1 polar amino acid transport system substrate-binding protein [Kribbella sandramycini]NOL43516.1 transporter substrate-binding domain-containing protein [Kribbella sandramycini]